MVFECLPKQKAVPKKNGPTIGDIAAKADVSIATADRVLNRRSGVRELTAMRVLKAAAKLGYLPEEEAVGSYQTRPIRVAFLLPAGTNPYLRLLGETVKSAAAKASTRNMTIRCVFIDSFNPKALVDALRRYGNTSDGVAVMAIDHPLVREAILALRAKNKHVVTIVSDISNSDRTAYVGLDNRAVGRTAALFLGRFAGTTRGKVAVIAASLRYRVHEEREMGFLGVMEESFPQIEVVGVREGHDNPDENYQHTLKLLSDYPDLIGIYNVGGSSDGVGRALREMGRDQDTLFIGHGLTKDTRKFLVEDTMDMVITQSPDAVVRNVLHIFSNVQAGELPSAGIPALTMEVIVKENL